MRENEGECDRRTIHGLALCKSVDRHYELWPDTLSRGQRASTEGTPCQRSETEFHCLIQGPVLERLQVIQGVLRLGGDERIPEKGVQCAGLGRRVVGNSYCADLAGIEESSERCGEILWVGERIRPMDLIQVDPVDAEPFEGCIERGGEMGSGRVVGNGWNDSALGCEGHPFTEGRLRSQDVAKEPLCVTEAVPTPIEAINVGGVDQVHPEIQRGLDESGCSRQIVGDEPPLAECQRADFAKWTERSSRRNIEFHGCFFKSFFAGGFFNRVRVSRP